MFGSKTARRTRSMLRWPIASVRADTLGCHSGVTMSQVDFEGGGDQEADRSRGLLQDGVGQQVEISLDAFRRLQAAGAVRLVDASHEGRIPTTLDRAERQFRQTCVSLWIGAMPWA